MELDHTHPKGICTPCKKKKKKKGRVYVALTSVSAALVAPSDRKFNST